MSEMTIWRIQFLMNNRWKFGALFADDIKLKTTDLFLGAYQFVLSLHRSLFTRLQHFWYYSKQLQNFSSFMRLYLRWLICCQLLWEAKVALSCLHNKKLLKTLKVAKTLPSTVYIYRPTNTVAKDQNVQELTSRGFAFFSYHYIWTETKPCFAGQKCLSFFYVESRI